MSSAALLDATADNQPSAVLADPAFTEGFKLPSYSSLRRKICLGAAVWLMVGALFGVAVAVAPSAEAVCHRLNVTTADGLPCVEGVKGRICPAQGTDCTVLSWASYEIQASECFIISCLLFGLWYWETPRRHPIQFCADNSKSIMLALTVSMALH